MPPSASAASLIADRHDASSVTSHSTAIALGPASFAAASMRCTTPGEQRDLIAALRKTDTDAAPEPTRGADHHCP